MRWPTCGESSISLGHISLFPHNLNLRGSPLPSAPCITWKLRFQHVGARAARLELPIEVHFHFTLSSKELRARASIWMCGMTDDSRFLS
jgi:hypothetical protein